MAQQAPTALTASESAEYQAHVRRTEATAVQAVAKILAARTRFPDHTDTSRLADAGQLLDRLTPEPPPPELWLARRKLNQRWQSKQHHPSAIFSGKIHPGGATELVWRDGTGQHLRVLVGHDLSRWGDFPGFESRGGVFTPWFTLHRAAPEKADGAGDPVVDVPLAKALSALEANPPPPIHYIVLAEEGADTPAILAGIECMLEAIELDPKAPEPANAPPGDAPATALANGRIHVGIPLP